MAHIQPSLLAWARTTAGYSIDEAAQKIGLSSGKLAAAESGDELLTVSQLRSAANAYKRPLAAFFLPRPPKEEASPRDFRRMSGGKQRALSPALRLEIRQTEARREEALGLARELGKRVQPFTLRATLDDNPETLGESVRDALGITPEGQRKWRQPGTALRTLKKAVEARHVLVFETSSVKLEEMRGFALSHRQFPVIVLNGKDAPAGRVFTLLHEFTHLMLAQTALCDPVQDYSTASEAGRIEVFCNHVAGAAIAPLGILNQWAPDDVPASAWNSELLAKLSRDFGTSKEVVLRRLLAAGRTTKTHYSKMRTSFVAEYAAAAARRSEGDGFVPQHRMVARNLSSAFMRLAFDAYSAERITARTFSEYLGVKLSNIPKLEAEIYGKLPE